MQQLLDISLLTIVHTYMSSNKKLSRLAGLLYLIVAVCGGFAEVYIRDRFLVKGDAEATANNIINSEGIYRLGLIADVVMIVSFALLGIVLYKLFRSVDKKAARLMIIFNLIGIPILCLNMLNHFAPLLLLSGREYLTSAFSQDQLNALSLLSLEMHNYGYILAQISTGIWLLPLGYLAYKSEGVPKIIGILLMLAFGGYTIDLFAQFLLPGNADMISNIALVPIAAIAELSFLLWLLIKGVDYKEKKNTQIS